MLPGYDEWKATPPEWIMPPWLRPDEQELSRMHRDYARNPFFDGDESYYEWLCEERDELARAEAHARPPVDDDFDCDAS